MPCKMINPGREACRSGRRWCKGSQRARLLMRRAGASIAGRRIEVRQLSQPEDFKKCHILFISVLEKKRACEILEQVKGAPVLTVGETEGFRQSGGVINFLKRDDKVRLGIDLNAARQA